MGGIVAEFLLGALDTGEGVTDVAGLEVGVDGFCDGMIGEPRVQLSFECGVEFVETGGSAVGDVVDLVRKVIALSILGWPRLGGSQEVGLDDIGNVAEIAGGFSIAIDLNFFAFDHGVDPTGNDSGIGTFGILTSTEDVEVTEAPRFQSIVARELSGVEFVNAFGDSVRRKSLA